MILLQFLFLFAAFIFLAPLLIFFLLFMFPPTRKLAGYFIKKKFEKMSRNGQVYYRSYHFKSGAQGFGEFTKTENLKDVTPISNSNLRDKSDSINTNQSLL
jgi:hypothetical protein